MSKGLAIVMLGSLISSIYFYNTNPMISLVSIAVFVSGVWTLGKI